MKRKINTIEISKPYLDPNLLGAGADCATTKVNAMYLKNKHKFTVCRGYLNSFESESNLYLVMAHELAHSIDPQGLLQEYFRNTSVAQLMREVRRTKGQLSCHDWRQKKEDVLSNRPEYYRLPFNFVDLTNCLVDRSGIKEGHPDTLRNAGEILTFKYLAAYANDDDFLRLINLNTLRYGEVTQNPFHLNPTLNDIVNNKIYEYSEYGEPYISLLFVQEYTCQNSGQDKLSDTDRVKLAIEEISKILRVYFESHFGAFGLEDGLMAGFQLSKPSSEDFADWMAQKAFEKYISKIESLKEKRSKVASSFALFCDSDDMAILAPEVALYLQQLRTEVHSINRQRRLRVYSDKIAREVRCTRGVEIEQMVKSCEMRPE